MAIRTSLLLLFCCCVACVLSTAAAAALEQPQDAYKVLGVRRSATHAEIRQAFRRLSREWHPDKNPAPEATARFQAISQAYDTLTDPSKQVQPWAHFTSAGDASPAAPTPEALVKMVWEGLHVVMDLDPLRLLQLSHAWLRGWASKHGATFEPLWHGSIDRTACWCLEQAWRLPQLSESVTPWLSMMQGRKHLPGSWRAWGVSGVLLELSAWSATQPHCLLHHASDSSGTKPGGNDAGQQAEAAAAEALARLQQQLAVRRRQQAIQDQQRRRQRAAGKQQSGGTTSTSSDAASDTGNASFPAADRAQTGAVWLALLVAASWLLLHDLQLAALAAVAGGGVWWLLQSDGAVAALAELLAGNSVQAALAQLGCLTSLLSLTLLAPLLLAGACLLLLTWSWAVVSFVGFALTPALSQFGLAMWLGMQAWGLTGGGALINSLVVVAALCFVVSRVPRFGWWWLSLLLAPLLLVVHFCKLLLLAAAGVSPTHTRAPAAAAASNAASREPQAGAEVSGSSASRAAAAAAVMAAAAVPLMDDEQPQRDAHVTVAAPGRAAAATATTNSSSLSRRSKTQRKRSNRLRLPDGPWWPASFSPADLAATAHWYASLIGWRLALWCLGVAATACKLTVWLALVGATSAAFGAPLTWLTLQRLVQLVLMRAGVAIGLILKLRQAVCS